MKIFIWEKLENLTDSYHSGGGLVVIASSVEAAIELARGFLVEFSDTELTPDLELNCEHGEERVFLFPDEGCC